MLSVQACLGIALMVSAVSLTRVYVRLTDVNLGPAPDKTLFFSVSPRDGGVLTAAHAADFNSQYSRGCEVSRACRRPHSLTASHHSVRDCRSGSQTTSPRLRVRRRTRQPSRKIICSTLGIPILFGRGFAESDRSAGTPVAIVDLEMARRNWASPRGSRERADQGRNVDAEVRSHRRRRLVQRLLGPSTAANDLPLAESGSECRRHGDSSNRFIDVHHCRACATGAWRHACSSGDVERNDATGTLAGDGDSSSSTDGRDARVGSDRSRPGRPGRVCAGGVDRRVPAAGTGDSIGARRLRAGTRVAGAATGDRRGRDGLGNRRSGNPRGATIGATVDQRRGERSCRADCAGLRPARFDSRVGWLHPRTIGSASDISGMASSPLSGNSASGGRR